MRRRHRKTSITMDQQLEWLYYRVNKMSKHPPHTTERFVGRAQDFVTELIHLNVTRDVHAHDCRSRPFIKFNWTHIVHVRSHVRCADTFFNCTPGSKWNCYVFYTVWFILLFSSGEFGRVAHRAAQVREKPTDGEVTKMLQTAEKIMRGDTHHIDFPVPVQFTSYTRC